MSRNELKVLFIGNSHTYFNDMPLMVSNLSEQLVGVPAIRSVMLAHPCRTLEEHLKEPEIHFNILYGNYDYVVLQQAAHPFPGEEVLLRDAGKINEIIKQTSSTPVAYMTWAEKRFPENQKAMKEAYTKLHTQIGGELAPVGIVWERIREKYPSIELFAKDGEHASPTGSYLISCVFLSVILKVSPIGLPAEIVHKGKCLYSIPKAEAEIIQKTVWELTAGFHRV